MSECTIKVSDRLSVSITVAHGAYTVAQYKQTAELFETVAKVVEHWQRKHPPKERG